MVERAVYTFGSDWVHETLQKINDDMMAAEDSDFSCTNAFKKEIKGHGTMAQYEFVVAQACEANVPKPDELSGFKKVDLAPRPISTFRNSHGKGKGKGGKGKGKGKGKGDAGKGWARGRSNWKHNYQEEDRPAPVLSRKRESPERMDEDGFVTVKQRRGGRKSLEAEGVEIRPALTITKYADHLAASDAWFVAVKSGSVKRVNELLDSGEASLEAVDNEGWTAIHHCAMLDYSEMLESLVARKADVNVSNKSKRTPLHIAADWDTTDCMKILANNGANISRKDSAGRTPLQYASDDARMILKKIAQATAESHSIFESVLEDTHVNGQLFRSQSHDGDSLKPTTPKSHLELPRADKASALQFHSDKPRKTSDPTLMASTSSTYSAPPSKRKSNRAPRIDRKQHLEKMFQASRMGDLDKLTELMKKQEIDLNIQDKEGWTVMHHASFMGQSNIIQYLLENGFDIGIKNKFGRTPLHLAAEWDNDDVVKLLLARKADINEPDNDGCTPLECAGEECRILMEDQSWLKRGSLGTDDRTVVATDAASRNGSVDPNAIMNFSIAGEILTGSDWEVGVEEIEEEKLLGSGVTAEVYKGTWRGTDVAIKKVNWAMASEYEATKAALVTELNLMLKLRHPGIVMVMGACLTSRPLRLICELCNGGALDTLLYKHPEVDLSQKQKWKMCMDVAQAMNYLHTSKPMIVHRDLKSLNLLLANPIANSYDTPVLKVSDFGLSKLTAQGGGFMSNNAGKGGPSKLSVECSPQGTYTWMAPELLERPDFYTEKVDNYSYGICMYEILARTMPFSEKGYESLSIALHVAKGLRPDVSLIPAGTARAIIELMEKCWHGEPQERPSFTAIIQGLREAVPA
ncbi:hypothetical protein FOL47_003252 [Perkinsus chesapeaki]|uniref:Protein kinase domain-containing protein n=1 Tax=Perkinsus chesapeaki TaxID=330153 RepID=A0A7J6N427_PERCH|nr:hypothetical protein FOL47_003252 [Perkinsus chesapeaki]